jgi:hypothetical protein
MPEMDGMQAVTELKSQPVCPKVLVLTMRSEPEIARTVIEAGVEGYLVKDCRRGSSPRPSWRCDLGSRTSAPPSPAGCWSPASRNRAGR